MLRKLTHIIIILTLILFNVKCTNESLDLWNEPSNSTIVNTRALNINSDEIGISDTSVEDTVTADIPRPDIYNDYDTDEIVDDGGLLYELLNKVNSDYYKPKTPFEYYYDNDSTDLFIIANVGWKWYYNGTHINQHYFNSELAINKFDYISFPEDSGSVTIIIVNDYETFSLYVSGYNASFVAGTYSFNSTSLYAGDSSHSYDGKEKKVFVYRIDVKPFITDDKDDYNDGIRRFAYAKWVCSIGNTPTSEFKIRCAQRKNQTEKIEILENIEY
jgi:hypothetical protein